MKNESKTPAPPQEPTLEELEALTNPNPTINVPTNTAKDAFAAAAAAPVKDVPEVDVNAMRAQVAARAEEFKTETRAFEIPAGEIARGESFTLGAELPVDPISALRMELKAEIAELRQRIAPAEGVLQATMRGTLYCPECKTMLDGGAATGVAHTPYEHPHESATGKPCKFSGWAFEKPSVSIRPLGPKAQLKPRMVG